jgi:hypothetical protein
MKRFFKSIAIAAITMFSVATASAQNAHEMAPTTATDLGTTLKVCYDIAGLGNVSTTQLTVNYTATITTECTNNGGNVAPGQTKVQKGSQTFTVAVNNGRATGCVTTENNFTPGKCPNGNWTGTITDVTFTSASVTVAKKTFTATLQ